MSLIKKYKAIVFDWDGTIADTMKYKRENFISLIANIDKADPGKVQEFHITNSGIARRSLIQGAIELLYNRSPTSEEVEKLSSIYSQMNLKSSKTAKIFIDAMIFIKEYRDSHLLFISSSSDPEELTPVVKNLKMNEYFKEVLGSKPNFKKGPQHINFICNKYNLSTQDMVFFGDDRKDYELGTLAKISTYIIDRKSSYGIGKHLIDSFQGFEKT